MQPLWKKTLTAVAAPFLTLLVLELALPLLVDVTDDIQYEHLPKVGLHLRPKQQGLFIRYSRPDDPPIRAHFSVNSSGFNNPREYHVERSSGTHRIAVVGDSFVEAFQVGHHDALFSVIERTLKERGVSAEVYSFGISGFGTAQIYHLIREYVLEYPPDFIVYLFIENDVADSSPFKGKSEWNQQYDLTPDGELVQLPFSEYHLSPLRGALKHSKLFRYFYYQRRWSERIRTFRKSPEDRQDSERIVGASREERAWTIVELLLEKIDSMLRKRQIPWLVVWQGDADPEYRAEARRRLESIVRRHGILYLDLSTDFSEDYAIHGRNFRIIGDGHWNRDGHRVAGTAIARAVAGLDLPPLWRPTLWQQADGRDP